MSDNEDFAKPHLWPHRRAALEVFRMGTGQAILHRLPIRLVSALVLGLVGGGGGRTPAQVFESVLKTPSIAPS